MSDDDQRRRPDETGEFFPFADEGESRPIDGPLKDDRTEQLPRAAGAADRTELFETVDDDATRVAPRATTPDGTRTQRHPRPTDNWADEGDQVWSARAGVRPQPPGYGDDFTRTDWETGPPPEPGGKWWTPIVVGIVGLLLLGLLGWGIYLIVQAGDDDDRVPESPASPVAPATTVPTTEPTATPSSVPPTTTPPTSAAPATPTDIVVPALKGLSSEEARAALDRTGLNYRLRYVGSDSPAGTVIDSDPAEGQQVPADTVITLVIAAQPTAPASAPTEPAGPGDPPDED